MTLLSLQVRSVAEFESAFSVMMQERPDGFIMTADPVHQLHLTRILDFLANNLLPAMFQVRENVVAGGLMSYGANLPDLFRRGAGFVQRILQGAEPADLPVELPTKFELVLNLKTAKELGLTISESFLLLADEVIE